MYGDSCNQCTDKEVKMKVVREAAKILGPTFTFDRYDCGNSYCVKWQFSKPA